jgi:5-formyltetrahydrofolate cyclo-ligase
MAAHEDMPTMKRALRAALRARLAAVNPARLAAASRAAALRICDTEEFRRASALMIFLPLRYEIDARPIALRAWQEGKTVTVPLVEHKRRHMTPVIVRSLEEPMDCDTYGVHKPRRCEPFPIDLLDVVVVPGLGFDRGGHRIGRGGGFYDRFLADPDLRATTCGLAIAEQMVASIPAEPHDAPLDMLATDEQLLRFAVSSMMERE